MKTMMFWIQIMHCVIPSRELEAGFKILSCISSFSLLFPLYIMGEMLAALFLLPLAVAGETFLRRSQQQQHLQEG